MNIVFVVIRESRREWHDTEQRIEKIFSTKEKAQAFIDAEHKKMGRTGSLNYTSYDIEEFVVE